jgi:mono/diheme cytochrome c family protein
MRLILAFIISLLVLPASAASPSWEVVERGRALATAGDCIACHTTPGGPLFAGGRAIETPFGNVLTPNLTPDRETGIGGWSDDAFVRALQAGIGHDGAHLYPAFPYPYYTRVARADLLAIRAWLATLAPVRNIVVRNQLSFPFDIRLTMSAWNALFFEDGEFRPKPGKSSEWNRGAYLVEGLGHCGACHTPKNRLGADRTGARLQGGAIQDWFAPSLGPDLRTGLGNWSIDDVVEYLGTGRNAKSAASGPMGEVVSYSTSHMPHADLQAMAIYLKDQPAPPPDTAAPLPATDPAMQAGRAIYLDNCAACHAATGAGIPRLFPTLAGNAVVQSTDPITLARIVLNGAQAVATDHAPTGPAMPGFGWKLNDDQTASLLTYIRNAWGNAAAQVDTSTLSTLRRRLAQRAAAE